MLKLDNFYLQLFIGEQNNGEQERKREITSGRQNLMSKLMLLKALKYLTSTFYISTILYTSYK